eukprot:s1114_g21.t1
MVRPDDTLAAGQRAASNSASRKRHQDFGSSSLHLEDSSGQGWLWSPRTGDIAETRRAASAETFRRRSPSWDLFAEGGPADVCLTPRGQRRANLACIARGEAPATALAQLQRPAQHGALCLGQLPTQQMLRKAMEKKAPLIKVQAEKRSNELGGGQLPRQLPSQLKLHLPLVAWEQFRDTINGALKREKATRVPTLLGVGCVIGSALGMILLHVLQFDSTFGEALLAVPPAVALCFWAVMRILLMKHSRKHQRCMQEVISSWRNACDKLMREHRALADVFCIDFRIIDEHLGREFRRSLPNVNFALDTDDKDSTRPPSGGSGSSALRAAGMAEADLQLRPMSAPDVGEEVVNVAGSTASNWTTASGTSRASREAWT